MAVSAAAVSKAAAMLLTNEKTRKGLGWILVAIFSPVILLIALLCSLGSGGAEHNNYSVETCFYGADFSAEVPAEFRYHIEEMRLAFSLLDSAVSSANGQMDSGNSLDPIRVKAVFYALTAPLTPRSLLRRCFGSKQHLVSEQSLTARCRSGTIKARSSNGGAAHVQYDATF